MARNPALFGFGRYPNVLKYASSQVSVIDPTYDSATMPATRLQTEEPSELARITTNNLLYTYWLADIDERDISGFALINPNLWPGGLVRFIAGAGASPLQVFSPNAIEASSNITGAVTAVDEVLDAPDANFIQPTTTSAAWSVRLSFGTGISPPAPTTGAHMAMFAIRAILSATALHYPTMTVSLYESGVLKRVLGSRAVSVSTGDGQLFYFTFDPAELADPTMDDVEVLIHCTPGDNAGGGTPNRYAKLNTVNLVADYATALGVHDSGFIEYPGSELVDLQGDPVPQISVDFFPATAWTDVSSLGVLIVDDQAYHDPPVVTDGSYKNGMVPASAILMQPAGYVQAGVFAAGPALILERGTRLGPESSVVVEGYEGVTEGGQTYGADAFRRRRMSVVLTLNRTEKDVLMNGIDWRRGRSGAFYVNLDPDLAQEHREFVAGWVTVEEAGAAVQMPGIAYDAGDLMLYTKAYVLDEKL